MSRASSSKDFESVMKCNSGHDGSLDRKEEEEKGSSTILPEADTGITRQNVSVMSHVRLPTPVQTENAEQILAFDQKDVLGKLMIVDAGHKGNFSEMFKKIYEDHLNKAGFNEGTDTIPH